MRLDNELFDKVQELAEASPRRRMHFDLRTGTDDQSQRMLNVMMPDTVIPIHRHNETSETVVVCRGSVREEFYDDEGNLTDSFVLTAGATVREYRFRRESIIPVYVWSPEV